MTDETLDFFADSANPLLGVAFLVVLCLRFPTVQSRLPFLLRSGLAVGITYVLSHLHDWLPLWKHTHGDFPSGHMTFFLTLTTCLALLERRSLWVTVPAALIYGWLIVVLNYHSWFDLVVSLFVAMPVAWLCLKGQPAR